MAVLKYFSDFVLVCIKGKFGNLLSYFILFYLGIDLSDMEKGKPYDYKFVKWMMKSKVGSNFFFLPISIIQLQYFK